ncbi:hypothetical protein [Streptomyces profundus]|uniref:hypothetical protein n=1 Tax=Streptomyces profundus TaxID=2867410 RepID=UPI001D1683FE|nr:hypothetical protein [Streptomyces sp. MA3_2.13]UED86479.1 hypothetical protein K4G22_21680 [Streptomyces sp. MA3_2.13]
MSGPAGAPVDWEFLLPAPGRREDNTWVFGPCWFFCGHQITGVLWIGCVTSVGANAPLYACGPCLEQLHAMAWDFAEAALAAPTDGNGRASPLYRPVTATDNPPATGRRRRVARTAFGARLAQATPTCETEREDPG